MRRYILLLLTVVLTFVMCGCGKKKAEAPVEEDNSAVKKEIVQLVNNDLPSIAHDRDEAVEIYNQYFADGAKVDNETWREQLESTALVSYDRYMSNLDALTYENSEVTNLKDIYKKSASCQRDAIEEVIDAIKSGSPEKLDDAKQSISDSKTYLTMYEDELNQLCTKYGINIVGQFQSASFTDSSASSGDAAGAEE